MFGSVERPILTIEAFVEIIRKQQFLGWGQRGKLREKKATSNTSFGRPNGGET